MGVRLWKVISSMPSDLPKSANRPISGSPMVPVPTTWTIFFIVFSLASRGSVRGAARRPEGYDENPNSPRQEGALETRLQSFTFRGSGRRPGGALEGVAGPAGGEPPCSRTRIPSTAARCTTRSSIAPSRRSTQSGYATLRFQFRGVGLSQGRYDAGRGEVDDFRAALNEAASRAADAAEARAGRSIVAGGFSFGAAMALKASDGDPRVAAFVGIGPSGRDGVRRHAAAPLGAGALRGRASATRTGPPRTSSGSCGEPVRWCVIPDADHFFDGHLEEVGDAIRGFLLGLAQAPVQASGNAS